MATLVPGREYLVIFGLAYSFLAVGVLLWASVPGGNQILWASFAAIFTYSFLLDFYDPTETLSYIPVTGIVPLLYLILILFCLEIRRLLPPSIVPPSGRISTFVLRVTSNRQFRKFRYFIIIGLYYTVVLLPILYFPVYYI